MIRSSFFRFAVLHGFGSLPQHPQRMVTQTPPSPKTRPDGDQRDRGRGRPSVGVLDAEPLTWIVTTSCPRRSFRLPGRGSSFQHFASKASRCVHNLTRTGCSMATTCDRRHPGWCPLIPGSDARIVDTNQLRFGPMVSSQRSAASPAFSCVLGVLASYSGFGSRSAPNPRDAGIVGKVLCENVP